MLPCLQILEENVTQIETYVWFKLSEVGQFNNCFMKVDALGTHVKMNRRKEREPNTERLTNRSRTVSNVLNDL
jgi:hypothetical protein